MKRCFFLVSLVLLCLTAFSQNTSPLKMINFHKIPNEMVYLYELKQLAGRDSDFDSNKAALIRVKAQGFSEKTMNEFTPFPRPGIEIIHKRYVDGEMWLYVSSNCQGEIVIKYMGEFEFKLPSKLEARGVYELVLGMETATLVIRAVPAEAEIYVDNQRVGEGESITAVSIGAEHRYRVVCEDYWSKEGALYFDKREEKTLNIQLEPNFGYITIKSEPSGADIFIDDTKVGTTPYQMKKIKLGNHVVELRKTGYENYADMVTIKTGEVNKQLENVLLAAVRVPMGSLELTSSPTGAVITINGRQYGQTPKTLTDIEVGTYTVYFTKEGYQNLSQTVQVKDGKKETLAVTLSKTNVQQPPVPNTTTAATMGGNRTFTVNGVSFEMVAVKGGTFTMGATSEQGSDAYSNEKPTHSVTLSDYYIGKFEVTQALWKAVMGSNPSYFKGDNLPVESVSWNDCQEFIKKLNQMTGQNFRLPTEAEWEYAARGGNKSNGYKYSGSNNIGDVAWYTGTINSSGTKPVGTKSPNELGIYDMSGNVWEWCQDWYGNYSSGSQTNPTGPSSGSRRVLRGGSWYYYAWDCRVSNRSRNSPGGRDYDFGFRVVLH